MSHGGPSSLSGKQKHVLVNEEPRTVELLPRLLGIRNAPLKVAHQLIRVSEGTARYHIPWDFGRREYLQLTSNTVLPISVSAMGLPRH